jgi:integrase/recombinase XerD
VQNQNSNITKAGRHVDQIGWDKVLTQQEQQQVRDYLDSMDETDPQNRQIKLIYELMIKTGLRMGELAMLRLRDCPAYLGVEAISVWRGKGNKDRTIPISSRLRKELQLYIDDIRPKTMPRWARKDIGRPVFYNFKGRPYLHVSEKTREIRGSTTLYRMIKTIGQDTGLAKQMHPHMLRHTFAVNALRNGVDIYMLMALMGHTSILMTARYLHLAGVQMKGLGEVLDRE